MVLLVLLGLFAYLLLSLLPLSKNQDDCTASDFIVGCPDAAQLRGLRCCFSVVVVMDGAFEVEVEVVDAMMIDDGVVIDVVID